MELLDGEPLAWVMIRERKVDPGRIGRLMLQALSALEAAHRAGIVHRDLKPENLFVTKSVEGLERIKILDFGISKFLSETIGKRLTRTGTVMGSPIYMSPEQAAGSKDIDHRTDIWSVGVIMYEALTGKEPFDGENYNQIMLSIITTTPTEPRDLVPEIPEPIEQVVLRAMAKDRDERYQTAAVFAESLRAALEEAGEEPSLIIPVTPSPASRAPKPPEPEDAETAETEPGIDALGETLPAERPRSRRTLTIAIAGVLAVVAIGAAIVAVAPFGTQAPAATPGDPRPAATVDVAEPATPVAPTDPVPQPEAPDRASVELRGLPEDARATLDGGAGTTAPDAGSEEPRDERSRRHSKRDGSRDHRGGDRAGETTSTPAPPDENAITGRHGSPIHTDYPGPE
jgi:serine/threonine-protein kinase